ncbi:PIN domain-containing protein [Thalassovita aquimarina]|uniref:PIN domain-containing protein n=1 Tax=Thalassovita aquimarina TaxID=2785917 RepID=A0ABS5HX71_9RHOB|nr:PIN domain-containing protein [Thalassovita aquimarina]MBR9653551.1 PIN domain-containing protein [Thalassovita aquimarina]
MNHGNRFTALIDASTLAGALRRNLILSLASEELFRVRWSDRILEETEAAISTITEGKADTSKQRAAMNRAFPEAIVQYAADVEGYLNIEGLPDPDDLHVIAAAVSARADVIVTENLKDFPTDVLRKFDIEVLSSDDFITDTLDLTPGRSLQAVKAMRERMKHPEYTAEGLLAKMEGQGLIQSSEFLREYVEVI